jgi:nucleotide-binding universal stress UspA family protein
MVSVDELQTENEKMIRKEAEVLHKNFNVEVACQVQIGMPSDEIADFASNESFSMIVIGMRGAGGIDKLIGSTTASVVRKASTPVLVIPHDSLYDNIKNIVYASDFSYRFSQNLFSPLLAIAGSYGSNVHVIHVQKSEFAESAGKEVAARNAISTLLEDVNHSYTIIHDDSITHGINSYVETHQVQLLVMVAHRHNFFDRLFTKIPTTEMAYQTKIPLLVLQDKS